MSRSVKKQPVAFERAEICKTCRHCHFGEVARCRRYPPAGVYDEEGTLHYAFPVVVVDMYCGEWNAKLDS